MSDAIGAAGVAAPQPPAVRELPLEFRATGGEYFRIWIVNLLLTIITLGIYSAWAKVRRLRYFYGSTSLEGSSFEYHGRPIAILKGRLITVGVYGLFALTVQFMPLLQVVFIPVAILGLPWVIMKARRFQMRMTSWRGLRFNFHGGYGGAMGAFIGWQILAFITLLILWPLALWKQVNYMLTNTAFGTRRIEFATTRGQFYKFCFITLAITIASVVLAVLLVAVLSATIAVAAGAAGLGAEGGSGPNPAVVMLITICTTIIFGLFVWLGSAYFRAHYLNASVGGARIGEHAVRSELHTLPLLGIMVTNLLAMIVTLGLFYPWAKVRLVRYQLANTKLLAAGELGQFVAAEEASISAVGEEVGDFFDVDFGF